MAAFKIFRYDPDDVRGPYFQSYDVNTTKGMTVLEGIFWVMENLDATLAFRCSCRAAICGSDAMHINGKYRLACQTQVDKLKPPVVIRPLAHLPVLKDLIVDMQPFFDNYKCIKPYLLQKDEPPEKEYLQSPDQRRKLDHHIDCILCGACYGSCPVAYGDPKYLGPHALLKVLRFVDDSRDGAGKERLAMVASEFGVFRCHTIFNCKEVCPKDLNPTGAISRLKNKILAEKFPILKFLAR
jgi:succinate dehydrogenase / fumarate reductase iron-sulfur subunit